MSNTLKRDLAGISDPLLLNIEVDDFDQKVEDAMPLEVRYACRYWTAHLLRVEHGDEAVVRALKEFSMRSILL